MSEPLQDLLNRAQAYLNELPPAPAPQGHPPADELAKWIEHSLLGPEATVEDVRRVCMEAKQYGFASLCLNPVYVPLANGLLSGSGVAICSTVSFPLGAHIPAQKVAEAKSVLDFGASELNMVINIGALKGSAYPMIDHEIKSVVEIAQDSNAKVKVILEMSLLTEEEKIIACLLSQAAGADFLVTSTGFGAGNATVRDLDLMRRATGGTMGIMAVGDIRTLRDARAMIETGARRLGTSAGVAILEEAQHGGHAHD